MDEQQTAIADQVYNQLTEALRLLMQPTMNSVPGIGDVRTAVVNAQNSVNGLH